MQNAQENPEEIKISINKVEWKVPYIFAGDHHKLQLLKIIVKDPLIKLSFRTWEMYAYPLIPTTQKHVWTMEISAQIEKSRYVIIVFLKNWKN